MSPSTGFAPNEPHALILADRDILLSQIFGGVGFGMVLVLYLQALSFLLRKDWRREWPLLIFTSLLFICAALLFSGSTVLIVNAFVNNRAFPDGPASYARLEFRVPAVIMGNSAFPIQSWLADSYLIYRCYVVYSRQLWITVFPSLLLLGSLVTGIFVISNETEPNSSFWATTSVNFAIPYFSLTIALNVIVTLLIIGKLLWARRTSRKLLGPNSSSSVYTSISAMLIESAALNFCTSIAFLVPYARGDTVSVVFQEIAAYNSIVSTLLIMVRVAQGRAWTAKTTNELSTLQFTPNSRSHASKSGISADATNPTTTSIMSHGRTIGFQSQMQSGMSDIITEINRSGSNIDNGSSEKVQGSEAFV